MSFYNEETPKPDKFLKLSTLSHPNLTRLFDCFPLSKTSLCFISEFCEGNNLKPFYSNLLSQISEKEAKNIIKQVFYGLAYLHDNKIIHGNLKPNNILFHHGNLKISDFWLFGEVFDNFSLLNFEEKAYYPPEFLSSTYINEEFDSSFDVWSAGVVFFEILFNTKPEGNNLQFQQKITQECKEFINKCLMVDAGKRLSARQALEGVYLNKI